MIVGKPKPVEEVAVLISEYKKVLILGCGTCVTVCLTGGDREARSLARELSNPKLYSHDPPGFEVKTIERQCERDMVKDFIKIPPECMPSSPWLAVQGFRPSQASFRTCQSFPPSTPLSWAPWMNLGYGEKSVTAVGIVSWPTRVAFAP